MAKKVAISAFWLLIFSVIPMVDEKIYGMDIGLSSVSNPILHLFGSRIEYHLVQNAVTGSILLVDFERGTYL